MNARMITRHPGAAFRRGFFAQRHALSSVFHDIIEQPNLLENRYGCHHFASVTRMIGAQLLHQRRGFSSSATSRSTPRKTKPSKKDSRNNDDSDSVILYERDPESNHSPRAVLGLAYFSSIYWTWYAIDFIPAVNSSPIDTLHIQPWWGVAACTVAYAINFAAGAYCKFMVSKVVLQTDATHPVHVYRHSLPFMMPSSKPMEYSYGDATLDYHTTEVQKLMDAIGAGQQQRQPITGHLSLQLKDRKFPLALYLTSTNDIKDKDLFLDTLLFAAVDMEEDGTDADNGVVSIRSDGEVKKGIATKQKPGTTQTFRNVKSKGRRRK